MDYANRNKTDMKMGFGRSAPGPSGKVGGKPLVNQAKTSMKPTATRFGKAQGTILHQQPFAPAVLVGRGPIVTSKRDGDE